jgi:hypothetical protein
MKDTRADDIATAIRMAKIVEKDAQELALIEAEIENRGLDDMSADKLREQKGDELLCGLSPTEQALVLDARFQQMISMMRNAHQQAEGIDVRNLSEESRRQHEQNLRRMRAIIRCFAADKEVQAYLFPS